MFNNKRVSELEIKLNRLEKKNAQNLLAMEERLVNLINLINSNKEEVDEPKGKVVLTAAPDYVKDYWKQKKEKLDKERG